MKKKILSIIKLISVSFFALFLLACLPGQPVSDNSGNGGEEEIEQASKFVYSDTCIVVSVSKSEQALTFQNLETGLRYTLSYDNLTFFTDRHEGAITGSQITSGLICDISFYREEKLLKSLTVSSDYFAYSNVEGFKFYNSATRMEYLGDKYELDDNLVVCSGKENISVLEISDTDVITIHGFGHTIYSITVDKGHGYVSLANDDYFIDGFIEIEKDIRKITEDMILTVPEGKYNVTISKDGTSAVKEVTVGRNQEATIDLSDVEIKKNYGNVTFILDPPEAVIYMDGVKIKDTSGPVRIECGIHELIVRADGYDTINLYLSVGILDSDVEIKLNKLPQDDSDDNDADTNENNDSDSNDDSSDSNEEDDSDHESDPAEGEDEEDDKNTYKVFIDAPKDVEVFVDGNYIGVAPTSFPKKVGTVVVTLKKDGYQTRSYTLNFEEASSDSHYSFSELIKLE